MSDQSLNLPLFPSSGSMTRRSELRLHLHSLVVQEAEVVVSADAEVGNAMQANKMKRPLSMIKKLFFIDFLLLLYISHNFLDFILL